MLATDLPLDARQLTRVLRRCPVGLCRLGSYYGHGSGELVVGFSTAYPVLQREQRDIVPRAFLNEKRMDLPFRAAAEASEEAVLCSLLAAETVEGFRGKKVGLREYLE